MFNEKSLKTEVCGRAPGRQLLDIAQAPRLTGIPVSVLCPFHSQGDGTKGGHVRHTKEQQRNNDSCLSARDPAESEQSACP